MAETLKFSDLCQFQPRQLEAAQAVFDHTFTFYGGASGGGKSYWLRWMLVYLCMYYAQKYKVTNGRVGLFCEDYPSLRERQLSKVQFEFPPWLGTINKSLNEFTLAPEYGGWTIAFRNLDDPSKYLSSEFAVIAVDELTRDPKETFDFLNMRRRWPNLPETKFIGASNPGGIGHGWVKKLWVDRDFTGEDSVWNPQEFAFIAAKATDNKYLGAAYEAQLNTLPEKLRKAYKDGNWDMFAGQYFTEWDRNIHVTKPFNIPTGWSRIRCLDYGYEAPSCCLWLAIDYDGNIYAYRELYERHLNYQELAQKIALLTPAEEKIEYTTADTSMFAKSPETGVDGDISMADAGVPITPASKGDRVISLGIVRQYLKQRKLFFFENCINSIRTIPALVHDELSGRVEDIARNSEDHAVDALRYGLASVPPLPQPVIGDNKPVNIYKDDPDAPWNQATTGNLYSYR